MNKYDKILKSWEVPTSKSTEEAWVELKKKIESGQSSKVRIISIRKLAIWTAAAASIAFAAIVLWPSAELVTYTAGLAKVEKVTLPDESRVILNAGSTVVLDSEWDKARKLTLDGEAFFEVKKGSTFQVLTNQGIVEVLGTSFDVFARKEGFKVKCTTGKVRVSANNTAVELLPGSMVELIESKLVVSTFDLNAADWQSGDFIYEDEPLANVFNEVARQFGVEIQTPDIQGRLYTGRFSNKNLTEALQLICLPMNLEFRVNENRQVTILSKSRE